jgi:hypothetical protein
MRHLGRSRWARAGRSRRSEQESGFTTGDYAVVTDAGDGFAGLLYTLLTGAFGDQLLERLFKHVMGLLGIG